MAAKRKEGTYIAVRAWARIVQWARVAKRAKVVMIKRRPRVTNVFSTFLKHALKTNDQECGNTLAMH